MFSLDLQIAICPWCLLWFVFLMRRRPPRSTRTDTLFPTRRSSDLFMHAYRTHTCADLRAAHVGERVKLSGWVHRKRDHGGVLFVDLRDHYAIGRAHV